MNEKVDCLDFENYCGGVFEFGNSVRYREKLE
jgi:predicted transcriptional regulator of viral defense system